MAPIAIAPTGATYPAAGVIATSPATAPDAAPKLVAFPYRTRSAIDHANSAVDAATVVLIDAVPANWLAPYAEPPLKPNHPNHKNAIPIIIIGKLCGGMLVCGHPRRRRNT